MRANILGALILSGLLSSTTPVRGEETAVAEQASTEKTSTIDAAKKATAGKDAAVAAEESSEFVIPPGFREKKRGQFTLYCRKEPKVGTRFPEEKCYDESGIREMLRLQALDRERFDQTRRLCTNPAACGML